MSENLVESLEQTLAEMESQQLASQQLLSDALAELESLYEELELRSNEIREGDIDVDDLAALAADGGMSGNNDEAVQQLQQERDELESQLHELRAELTNMSAACESQEPEARPRQPQIGGPGEDGIRAPFEELRQQLADHPDGPCQDAHVDPLHAARTTDV